jgi:hypothetical protein
MYIKWELHPQLPYYRNSIAYISNTYAVIPLINQSLNLKALFSVSYGNAKANILLTFYVSKKSNGLFNAPIPFFVMCM